MDESALPNLGALRLTVGERADARACECAASEDEETPVPTPTDAPLDWREQLELLANPHARLHEWAVQLRRDEYNDKWLVNLAGRRPEGDLKAYRAHYSNIVGLDNAAARAHPYARGTTKADDYVRRLAPSFRARIDPSVPRRPPKDRTLALGVCREICAHASARRRRRRRRRRAGAGARARARARTRACARACAGPRAGARSARLAETIVDEEEARSLRRDRNRNRDRD